LHKTPPVSPKNKKLFFDVIKAAFSQRRKTLSNALISSFGSKLSKQDCNDIIAECGFSETVRGEELDISAFSKIADSIFDRII
jgi:16S rRNA (adenine1518-N6/adenine1519-N6)-dimethyltransferase